ncbi:hypothetical protein GVAV_001929 [Gurleya vavrai]
MVFIEVIGKEEPTPAGSLKVGFIIIVEKGEKRIYVKVTDVSKCKTGKHGAAKVMVSGKEVVSGKTYDNSFRGSDSILVSSLTKKQYILEDIFEENDDFYMRPADNSGTPSQPHECNQFERDDVNKIIEIFMSNNRCELLISFSMTPEFKTVDDIKPVERTSL